MTLREQLILNGANAIANDRAEEVDENHFEDTAVALDAFIGDIDSHLAHRLSPEFEGDERTGIFRLLAALRRPS